MFSTVTVGLTPFLPGAPSLPFLPSLPAAPSLPGLPSSTSTTWASLASVRVTRCPPSMFSTFTVGLTPSLPGAPSLPSRPGAPSVPSLPGAPVPPSLPGAPSLPLNLPSSASWRTLLATSSALLAAAMICSTSSGVGSASLSMSAGPCSYRSYVTTAEILLSPGSRPTKVILPSPSLPLVASGGTSATSSAPSIFSTVTPSGFVYTTLIAAYSHPAPRRMFSFSMP